MTDARGWRADGRPGAPGGRPTRQRLYCEIRNGPRKRALASRGPLSTFGLPLRGRASGQRRRGKVVRESRIANRGSALDVQAPARPAAERLLPLALAVGEDDQVGLAGLLPALEDDLVDAVAVEVEVVDVAAVLGARGGRVLHHEDECDRVRA